MKLTSKLTYFISNQLTSNQLYSGWHFIYWRDDISKPPNSPLWWANEIYFFKIPSLDLLSTCLSKITVKDSFFCENTQNIFGYLKFIILISHLHMIFSQNAYIFSGLECGNITLWIHFSIYSYRYIMYCTLDTICIAAF